MAAAAQINPMNKWRLDLGSSSRTLSKTNVDPTFNPPGYIAGFVASQKVIFSGFLLFRMLTLYSTRF